MDLVNFGISVVPIHYTVEKFEGIPWDASVYIGTNKFQGDDAQKISRLNVSSFNRLMVAWKA